MKNRYIGILALIIFLTTAVSSAQWTVYQGDSVSINENSTLIWGQNYTFNSSGLILHEDTLEINRTGRTDNYNISIYGSSSINSTLYNYSLNSTPADGEVVLKVETEASGNVNYEFNQIPSISSGRYDLEVDGTVDREFSSGGTVSWSHSDWSSNHNFSLVYRIDNSRPNVSLSLNTSEISVTGAVNITCSSSDPQGIQSTSLTVTLPDGSSSSESCNTSFTQTSQEGDYTINYTATDSHGNINYVMKNFTAVNTTSTDSTDTTDDSSGDSSSDSDSGGSSDSSGSSGDSSGGFSGGTTPAPDPDSEGKTFFHRNPPEGEVSNITVTVKPGTGTRDQRQKNREA